MDKTPDTKTSPVAEVQAPVVICVAPNGARRTKTDHPALPMTADELAREAALCADAGASVIHLHVRKHDGTHSLDVDQYREAISSIQTTVNDRLLIQVTTEAVGIYRPHEQIEVVRALRPQAASVAIRELIPDAAHSPAAISFFEWCGKNDVALQFIVYSPDEARKLQELACRGNLGCDMPNTLFVLGRYTAGQISSPRDVLPFLEGWPLNFTWSVCAFGPTEALCMAAAIGLGGHARVGFENNLQNADGTSAIDNAALVANVAELARRSGRNVSDINTARALYGANHR